MRFYSDFTQIERITPEAALVVAALYDRVRELVGTTISVFDYEKWKPSVQETLEQVGFFESLGLTPDAAQSTTQGSQMLRIARYESGDKLRQERAAELLESLLNHMLLADPTCLVGDDRIEKTARLFGALVEATENTRSHAYPTGLEEAQTILPHWWLSGSADPIEKKLTLVVYDMGISIPGSLASFRSSKWWGHDRVNAIIRRYIKGHGGELDAPTADHVKLRLAMRMGESSTGERHRGKGLPVVRDAITHCKRGTLRVFSRFGVYEEQTGSRPISRPLSQPFPGTLIIWDLWL